MITRTLFVFICHVLFAQKTLLANTFPANVYISSAFNVDSIIEKNRQFFPKDTKFNVIFDSEMDDSVMEMSDMLEKEGLLKGLYEAYSNLTPWAYRVDIWRNAILFVNGGVYLDAKMILKSNYTAWVDVYGSKLSLCWDHPGHNKKFFSENVYWNGVMASKARNPVLLTVLKQLISNVMRRYYGHNALCITGPIGLHDALKRGNHLEDIHGKCILSDKLINGVAAKGPWKKDQWPTYIIKSYPDKSKVLIYSNPYVHYGVKSCKTCHNYVQLWMDRKVYCDRLTDYTGFEHCNKSKELLISKKMKEILERKWLEKNIYGDDKNGTVWKIHSGSANPSFYYKDEILNKLGSQYLGIIAFCILATCFLLSYFRVAMIISLLVS